MAIEVEEEFIFQKDKGTIDAQSYKFPGTYY